MKILISNNKVIGVYNEVIETATEYLCDNTVLPKSVIGVCTVIDGDASIGDIWDGVSFTKPVIIPVVEVPQSVTMSQARKALYQAGLYDTVNTTIMNGTDAVLKIEWEFEPTISRANAGLIAMANTLGLTSTQLDELFILGATL